MSEETPLVLPSVESMEGTFRKLKNTQYVFLAGLLLNAGMMYQQNKDNVDSQRTINQTQLATNASNSSAIQQIISMVQDIKSNSAKQDALIAGQERRLEMLENRSK